MLTPANFGMSLQGRDCSLDLADGHDGVPVAAADRWLFLFSYMLHSERSYWSWCRIRRRRFRAVCQLRLSFSTHVPGYSICLQREMNFMLQAIGNPVRKSTYWLPWVLSREPHSDQPQEYKMKHSRPVFESNRPLSSTTSIHSSSFRSFFPL